MHAVTYQCCELRQRKPLAQHQLQQACHIFKQASRITTACIRSIQHWTYDSLYAEGQ
jgi:hypothetical protein